MKKINIKCLLSCIVLLFSTASHAVSIDTMYVENASATLTTSSFGSFTATSGTIAPPAEIIMGVYQNSILNISDISTGFNLNIYSTDSFGQAAPSGTVNGTTVDVDFSSLRATMLFNSASYDFELWPLTTSLDYGSYVPANNTFDIGWSENLTLDLTPILSESAILDVSLQGYLTTAVPLPAAFWLFSMGLISVFGYASRGKRK